MISAISKNSDRSGGDRSGNRRCGFDCRGFTLLELLVVIGLLGLMLGLTLPRVGSVRSAYFATETARQLVHSVRSAHLAAIREQTTVLLSPSLDGRNHLEERRLPGPAWRIENGVCPTERGDEGHSVVNAPVVRSIEVSGFLEVESPGVGILFYANGTSSGGRIMIRDEDGALKYDFLVDPSTGALFAQR